MYLSTSAISLELGIHEIPSFAIVPDVSGGFDIGFDAGFTIIIPTEGALLLENYSKILLENGTGVILKG